MYIENAKLNPETRDFVEIAIKLPTNVLLPIDSHWPKERFKDVIEAFNSNDKEKLKNSRKLLADALRKKAEDVKEKYINPPKSTPFAFVQCSLVFRHSISRRLLRGSHFQFMSLLFWQMAGILPVKAHFPH